MIKKTIKNKQDQIPQYMTLNASLSDTNLTARIPTNWLLLSLNATLPFYLFTQNLLLTLGFAASLYCYGLFKTQTNISWSKNIKKSLLFKFYLAAYVVLLILATIKVFN